MTRPALDVAEFMARAYASPPCWELVADIYTSVLGEVVGEYKTVSTSIRASARAFRLALHKSAHGFRRVDEPEDYAVVLMGRSEEVGIHHCGLYYAGKVLHALPTGTLHQDLPSLGDEYLLMEFWAK